ncbi:Pyruvate/2-oxoglutarate dehydrogenase complex, dihydrolipoamide dehydrogenase (E3) component [Poseidonocella pacifica]|uniref:Pyruvate/2-oxoglutarate dehydrogenase complex, dihydrolipoamide dehydrogenase (E3) component n=1 Tax=Poseidonocella pacifica TaxID=871651 RepID=A0A1I0XJ92_9RHOB|nr:FAD-dependent oxidoreductase [Poseidonocella pacifica]SFB00298.1 Pyruvate/2-oxoglutarate dehydrogenase complex, dihydrolipoamide dehydrogenase (E3) component [Poseidonocella pacifica]
MAELKTDILVIGAGSAGLSVAAGAVQMGADVILVEGREMGGDCLNYGCVPSKALIAAAAAAQTHRQSGPLGIAGHEPEIDYAKAQDHVAEVIASIAPVDSEERFEGLGVRVIREWAEFIDDRRVQAGEYTITARRIVLATGSSPLVPPIPGLDGAPYLTNESLWKLRDRPDHLIVVGGGPIGMEMAQAHRRLGSAVTVVEGQRAFGKDDPELAEIVLKKLRAEGIEIFEGAQAEAVRGEEGAIELDTSDGRTIRGSHLLVAVGRQVNTDGMSLEKAGVERTKSGIKVDASMRTTNRRVYAIGDAAGGMQFTHVAGYHAGVIIRSLLFALPAKTKTAHLPWCSYTRPELAQVGLTEAQARKEYGGRVEVFRFNYDENDRAIAERETDGLIKIMVVSGRPVGASIVGAQAGDLIGFWSLAIANRFKMTQLANMVVPYPTISEVNKRVVGAYFSPRLFENPTVKRIVRLVQRWIP